VSSEELQQRQLTSLDDVARVVPGLSALSNGSATRRIILRGISNISGDTSSLIGVYLDEASVTAGPSSQLDLRTYDLDRIEVLRGPQGTLYGEGSIGGTIRFITKNPQLSSFGADAHVVGLYTEDGSPSERVNGMVNLPLISDVLGLRISGTYEHNGGWIDQPAVGRNDFNTQSLKDVRIKGLWEPVSDLSVLSTVVVHRNKGSATYGEDANGNFTQVFGLPDTPRTEDDYNFYGLTVKYDLPKVQFVSASGYTKQDASHNGTSHIQLAEGGYPQLGFYINDEAERTRTWTEELRASSLDMGSWKWTVGAFYRHYRNNIDSPVNFFGVQGPPGTPIGTPIAFPLDIAYLSKSWAAFMDTSYELFDRLTLGTGVRYYQDDEEYNGGDGLQSGRFHAVNPRFYAEYKFDANLNAYASAAKGFRSGGFNLAGQPPFDPEHVWTYELGTKTSIPALRLTADAAIFYSDYKDYQMYAMLLPP